MKSDTQKCSKGTVNLEIQSEFTAWLDRAMAEQMPDNLVAFNFNLAEARDAFQVDVIGANSYDPADSNWACEEKFVPETRFFNLPHSVVGKEWQYVRRLICGFVADYIRTASESSPLRKASAVCVGFVDADLIRVWPEP